MDTIKPIYRSCESLEEIRAVDGIFGICSLDNYYHGVPTIENTERMVAMCEQMDEIVMTLMPEQ
ncbi:hypothetical protein LQZ18_11115 [Lachnospiraceae bacterium ZAX-1]